MEVVARSVENSQGLKDISKIYGSSNVKDYSRVLIEQSKELEYHPFVEYKESPRDGQFVTVSESNTRCNINATNKCVLLHGDGVIWVFGGSTVFGYGVKNEETIPAYLEDILPNYKVINMGHASYYSTPELILFNNQLADT